jgi:hypothetical protein
MHSTRPSLHPPLIVLTDHQKRVESAISSLPGRRRSAERLVSGTGNVQIPLTAVSLNSNFDAYIDVWFSGSPADSPVCLLLDSGNSMLVIPRWEDIVALPNQGADYSILGTGPEPWGCPANIVQGPIDLVTSGGDTLRLPQCQFYACTDDSPSSGRRTANFGAGCLAPWASSGWNTPAGTAVTLKAPLAYTSYPLIEFAYAAAATIYGPSGTPKVTTGSNLNLLTEAPAGYTILDILPDLPWMSLTPKALSIGATKTGWPGAGMPALAMIDTGGGPAFLSDPQGYVYGDPLPDGVPNPDWTSGSTKCESTSNQISIAIGDASASGIYTYTIDPSLLPASARGLTLVACEMNEYMRGQYGMNIGGLSALANYILVDYQNARVGFKPK